MQSIPTGFFEAFIYIFAAPRQVRKIQGHEYPRYYCNPIVNG